MKWLLIVVLVCSVLISGCSSNKTGYECFSCEEQVSGEARTCPHCGQPFDFKAPTALQSGYCASRDLPVDQATMPDVSDTEDDEREF